jgi:hypothetical protein
MARLILNAAHGWKPPLKDPKSLDVEVHHDAVMLSGSDLVNKLVLKWRVQVGTSCIIQAFHTN